MKIIAVCEDGDGYDEKHSGRTREEAAAPFIKNGYTPDCYYIMLPGGWLELNRFEALPHNPPLGCGIIVFVRSSHNTGYDYDWQIFTIPSGTHRFEMSDPEAVIATRWLCREEVVVEKVSTFHTMDSNSSVIFHLPDGSWKFVDGQWVPYNEVRYNY